MNFYMKDKHKHESNFYMLQSKCAMYIMKNKIQRDCPMLR